MNERKRSSRQVAVIAADLTEGARYLGLGLPRALERLLDGAGALLERRARHLLGVGAGVGEADRHLERAGAGADLGADADVAGARPVVLVREAAVGIAEVDVNVGAAEVARRRAAEGSDDADPHVLLPDEQGRRVSVDDPGLVALGAGLPVRGGLHVEAEVGQLWGEGRGDEHRVELGVGEELLGQPVLVMSRIDPESRHAWRDPGDRVLAVDGVIDRRGAAGGGEEAELVEGDSIEKGEEDLAEVAVGERVPELAPGTWRCSERHLASRPPHRGRAWSAGGFHRVLSMERGP